MPKIETLTLSTTDTTGARVRFCERCGHPLERKTLEGRERPVCPSCGFVVYLDPKVAAGAIVTVDGRVVLVKRTIEPSRGKWVFPGGYVDRGESTEAAAVREVREEVGLEIRLEDLLGVFSYTGVPVVLVVYTGRVAGGKLEGGAEAEEARAFHPSEIPWEDLGFQSTADALRRWVERNALRVRD
jgi:ADP-ribose pyrophosphatase YjhB (NUDIX family)